MLPLGVAFFYQNRKMKKINGFTTKLFYREKGNPESPPLIIFHGLWGASENWLPVAERLSSYFHVILPDCRNHGLSPHLSGHDYEYLSKDACEFIRQLHLPGKPFLAGHSMGGKTLMTLLLQHPDIAEKASIIDACPYPGPAENIHREIADFMTSHPLNSYRKYNEIATLIRNSFPEEQIVQLFLKNIRKSSSGYEWKVNASVLREYLPDLCSWHINSPVLYQQEILFVKGGLSNYIPPASLPEIHRYFPAASLQTIPGATHRIHTDQPEKLAEILTNFFLPLTRQTSS